MKYNKRENRISPVIVVVILVSIVVLTAILYVMVTESPCCIHREIPPPLGLKQDRSPELWVTIIISSAPDGATTDGARISYIHNGTGTPVDVKATLYSAAGTLAANYTNGSFDNNVPLTTGMTLVVTHSGTTVQTGDVITITSSQDTFSTSTITVS